MPSDAANTQVSDYPPCLVCGEDVKWGIGDPSGVWWHPECFRQVVRKGGVIPKAEATT